MKFFYNILDKILLEFADFSAFHFEHKNALYLLLLPILFLLFEVFPARKSLDNRKKLLKFVDAHLIEFISKPFNSKKNYKRTFYFCAIYSLLILAIANPRWNFIQEETFKPNINIVLLLDVSKSMNVEDIKPNRIERARQEIEDITKNIQGASIGLIAFADNANIIAPITDDKNALKYFLSAIDPDIFSERASRVDKGVEAANRMLKRYEDGDNFIIILSDGGFEVRKNYTDIIDSLKNTHLVGIGLGTEAGGAIPIKNEQKTQSRFINFEQQNQQSASTWQKDENGKMVISKLDEAEFKKLVAPENYVKASYLDDDTKKIVDLIKNKTKNAPTKQRLDKVWNDKFYIPLIIAMILVLFKFKRGAAFPVVLILVLSCLSAASASAQTNSQNANKPANTATKKETSEVSWHNIKKELSEVFGKYFKNQNQQAQEEYSHGNYGEAATKFTDSYNKGVAEFRAGNLQEAVKNFSKHLESQPNNADDYYNIGNSLMFMPKVEEAIKAYETALKINPNMTAAKQNLEIAKEILDQQKKQEEQNNKQQNNQQKNKNNKNNNDKNDNKNNENNRQNSQNNPEQNSDKNGDKSQQNIENNSKESDKDGNNKPNSEKPADDGEKKDNKQNNGGNNDTTKPENTDSKNPLNDPKNQNNGQNQQGKNNKASAEKKKSSLDASAEEMMNRLKNDPSELLKRRFKMNNNKDNDEAPTGGNRPW